MNGDASARHARTDRTDTVFSAGFAGLAFPAGFAVLFLALHLPYLPQSLEDLDSINFALGLRHFDVAHHQPHPPGYPVFIAIAKAVHAAGPTETTALALVSAVAGALGVLALAALFGRFDEAAAPARWRVMPVAVAMTAPLYWFTAVRPLSDAAGLAAALAVQAMTLAAGSTSALATAAFCAGLATGLRSQVAWLTLPLLIAAGLKAEGTGLKPHGVSSALSPQPSALSRHPVAVPLTLFVVGILLWFIPLVVLTGGPAAYWHALFDQGAEDLGNIQMLWTMHGVRDLRDALYYAFVAPWAVWPLAAVVLTCAVAGVIYFASRNRRVLTLIAIAFGPYLVFDLLFQETFTSRYALPLVVPIAYLAVAGLRLVPYDIGLAAATAVAMFSAHVGGTSIAAFSRAPAPAFQLLEAMKTQTQSSATAPVLAPDRREGFDLRGPRKWLGDGFPTVAQTLPYPPQHEWLEAVKYWNSGGGAPVWFVVDPLRASIDLVQHGEPSRFRWNVPYPVLLSGTRPNEMDWYRVERPEWYVGEGWALTPESAGIAAADRRGPSLAPIDGWLLHDVLGGTLMIGGRNLAPSSSARVSLLVEGRTVADVTVPPGAFLRFVDLPAALVDARNPLVYARVTVQASAGSDVAIEQFDASATRSMFGFGDGWHEPELNPATGRRWRWLSERGELQVRSPRRRLTLHVEGESPRAYFSHGSRLIIRSGDRVVFDEVLSNDFSRDIPVVDPAPVMMFETDQTYVPAERSRRTQDRRRLGMRLFSVTVS